MVLVFVAAAWLTASVPITLVVARLIAGPHRELYAMDGTDALYRFPDGTIERFAMLQPVRRH